MKHNKRKSSPLRNLIRILFGTVLIEVITFLILILIDATLFPEWLTETTALLILGLAFIGGLAWNIIRIRKRVPHHETNHIDPVIGETTPAPVKPAKEPEHVKKSGRKHKRNPLPLCIAGAALIVIAIFVMRSLHHSQSDEVPYVIREFVRKYPEASEYADHYLEYCDKRFDMDVSAEMAENDIPLFIQWDKRWGYKNYGENYVGVAGCAPTCMAMVVCGLTGDAAINPYVVSKYSAGQGYYTLGQGTSWDLMTTGAKYYGLSASTGRIDADYILENVSGESPMICSMKPGDFTTSGHFIVLAGLDEDGKVIVNDPNSPKNSKKHWDADTLVSQMKGIWIYRYN
jgi:hypothetical protein